MDINGDTTKLMIVFNQWTGHEQRLLIKFFEVHDALWIQTWPQSANPVPWVETTKIMRMSMIINQQCIPT